jgi:thioredoxin 1
MYAVKWGAEWCPPCQKLDPQLAQLVEDNPELEIFDVDVDEIEPEVQRDWGVTGIPVTFILNDNDEVVDRIVGAVPPAKILETLNG